MSLFDGERSLTGSDISTPPIEQPKDPTATSDPAANHQTKPSPKTPISIIAQRSDAEIERYERDDESEKAFRRKSLFVQWALFLATLSAFGAAAWYAHIAERQAKTMDKTLAESTKQTEAAQGALAQAKTQFTQDQRPYLWIASEGNPTFYENPNASKLGQVFWTWHLVNYGKTPARDVRFSQYISIGNGPFIESFGAPPNHGVGAPIPPTKENTLTVISAPGVSKEKYEILTFSSNPGNTASIRIRITYSDAYSGKYETGICLHRLGGGSVAYCGEDGENYIK
jgi:hypothetical protein